MAFLSALVGTRGWANFVFAITVLILVHRLCRAIVSPHRSIPGPFLARFTRLWKLRHYYAGNYERVITELHAIYGMCSHFETRFMARIGLGPIVRVSPWEYSFDDPAALKVIYGHGSQFVKVCLYTSSTYFCC